MLKLTATLLGLLLVSTAHATSHRTFVAASGTDVGACGPNTPCRSLSYALSQTNSGGEIVITQSGGYGDATGGLVIDKSVSIIAEPGVFAALAPTSGNGITIATAGIDVAIKGLTINGRGGSKGISMTAGASLDLDNVTITNFSTGWGVVVQAMTRMMIKNSTFRKIGIGIEVGYMANLMVSGSKLTDISDFGILITGGSTGTTVVTATDTLMRCTSASAATGFANFASTGTVGRMLFDRVTTTNCNRGMYNWPYDTSATQIIALSNSFVTGNAIGLANTESNVFLSSGNNHVANNETDITGSVTASGVFK